MAGGKGYFWQGLAGAQSNAMAEKKASERSAATLQGLQEQTMGTASNAYLGREADKTEAAAGRAHQDTMFSKKNDADYAARSEESRMKQAELDNQWRIANLQDKTRNYGYNVEGANSKFQSVANTQSNIAVKYRQLASDAANNWNYTPEQKAAEVKKWNDLAEKADAYWRQIVATHGGLGKGPFDGMMLPGTNIANPGAGKAPTLREELKNI